MFYLRTFGGLTIERDGVPIHAAERHRKRLSLLAVLAANGPQGAPRESLLELLWPERDSSRARASLKQSVFALRRQLGEHDVIVGVEQLRLNEDLIGSDIGDFKAAIAAGDVVRAMELNVGRFLDGVFLEGAPDFDVCVESVRSSITTALRAAAVTIATREEWAGNWARASELWERATRADPLGADVASAYIAALARSGDESRALEYAQRYEALVRAELDAPVSGSVAAVVEEVRHGRLSPPKSLPAVGPATARRDVVIAGAHAARGWRGLPHMPGAFVGRAPEVEQIEALLADSRVVTIAGPGGAGKTRLAIEAGMRLETTFPDGVSFVALAGVRDPRLVAASIADAIGATPASGRDAATEILEHLRGRRTLLVLDQFEAVSEAAPTVAGIAAACGDVRVLVTSQDPVGIGDESVLMIGGLRSVTASDADGPAVELFIRRARQARAGFDPDPDERNAIRAICRAVGGLPFAIELAAPYVRAMTCSQLAREIARDPDILGSGRRDVPERQRSLRCMVEYSLARLDPMERAMLARLSATSGPLLADAAMAVSGASPAQLARLVERSLVWWDRDLGYELPPTFRSYLAEGPSGAPRIARDNDS